jgi:hypothetical protein
MPSHFDIIIKPCFLRVRNIKIMGLIGILSVKRPELKNLSFSVPKFMTLGIGFAYGFVFAMVFVHIC